MVMQTFPASEYFNDQELWILSKNCWEEFAKLKEIIEVLDKAHGKVNELETLIQQVEEAIHECSVTKEEREKERRKHSLKKQQCEVHADSKSTVEQRRKGSATDSSFSYPEVQTWRTENSRKRQVPLRRYLPDRWRTIARKESGSNL